MAEVGARPEEEKPAYSEDDIESARKGGASEDEINEMAGIINGSTEEKNSRPDNVPEKFWNTEKGEIDLDAWNKATKELEQKLHSDSSEGEEESTEDSSDEAESKDDKVEEIEEATGIDFDDLAEEFLAEGGALTQETLDTLAKRGIPNNVVATYLQGVQAQVELAKSNAHNAAGGEEAFKNMIEWATQNLTDGEIDAFNEGVGKGGETTAMTVTALRSRYEDNMGKEPTTEIKDGETGSTTAESYESLAQMKADMSSTEYDLDPAFRKKVEAKISRSPHIFE